MDKEVPADKVVRDICNRFNSKVVQVDKKLFITNDILIMRVFTTLLIYW